MFEFLNTSKHGARGTIADAQIVDRCVVADVVVHDAPPGTFPVAPLLERNPSTRIRFEVRARNEFFDLQPILDRYRRRPVAAR